MNTFEKKEVTFSINSNEINISLGNIESSLYDIIVQYSNDIEIVTFSRLKIYNPQSKVVPKFSMEGFNGRKSFKN